MQHILERTAFKMNLNELFIQGGLYNLNSSEAERRKKIEDILLKRRKDNENDEEEEILDDDMINQYLRRSDVHSLSFRKSTRSLRGWMRREWAMSGTTITFLWRSKRTTTTD